MADKTCVYANACKIGSLSSSWNEKTRGPIQSRPPRVRSTLVVPFRKPDQGPDPVQRPAISSARSLAMARVASLSPKPDSTSQTRSQVGATSGVTRARSGKPR